VTKGGFFVREIVSEPRPQSAVRAIAVSLFHDPRTSARKTQHHVARVVCDIQKLSEFFLNCSFVCRLICNINEAHEREREPPFRRKTNFTTCEEM